MPTPEEIQTSLDTLVKNYESAETQLKAMPGMEKQLQDLQASHAELKASIKAQAERKGFFTETITGDPEKDRKLAAGSLIKGLVANAMATTNHPDSSLGRLNLKNEQSCRQYGYVGEEKELAEHMLTKASTFGLASLDDAGGVFVSHELMGDYVKKLRPSERVIFDAGARYTELPAGAGVFTMPVQKSLASATSVDEGGQLVMTGLEWGMKTMTPRRIGNATLISRRLLFSAARYEEIMVGELSYGVWREIQRQIIKGTGIKGEANGLYADTGVSKVFLANGGATSRGSTNGKINTYTDANLMEDLLAQANGRTDGFSIIARSEVIRNMKNSIINSNGTFNLTPENTLASDENLKKALGSDRKFFRLTDMDSGLTVGSASDCSRVLFGQMDNIEVMTWGGPQIKVSAEAVVNGKSAFERNALALAMDINWDALFRQTGELFFAEDARTASAI